MKTATYIEFPQMLAEIKQGKTTAYKLIKNGHLPKPIKPFGGRKSFFILEQIQAIMKAEFEKSSKDAPPEPLNALFGR